MTSKAIGKTFLWYCIVLLVAMLRDAVVYGWINFRDIPDWIQNVAAIAAIVLAISELFAIKFSFKKEGNNAKKTVEL